LNEETLHETINIDQLFLFLSKFEKKSLEKKVNTLLKVYGLSEYAEY